MSHPVDPVVDQFTKQAAAFAAAPCVRDEDALQLLVRMSEVGPSDTVLDVACGPGVVACAFAPLVRLVTGVDVTPAMIERAKALQRQKGLRNLTWRVGDVRSLPFPDGSFSRVLSRYAFHHLADPPGVLREMVRVCAPGGCVLIADMTSCDDLARAAALNTMERLRDPSHVRALSRTEMEAMFDAAGLTEHAAASYRVELEMEALLAGSFPEPGDGERVRAMLRQAARSGEPGLDAWVQGEEVHLAYTITVLAGRKPVPSA